MPSFEWALTAAQNGPRRFPAWLTIKKDMVVRDNDPQYLHYVDEHMAKIYAIVAKHQISKGGSVILVQLENEHPKGYGTQAYPYLNQFV